MVKRPSIGLVLSGGGARGAYEAGLIAGIVEVLGLRPDDPPPFDLYAGTSVGAINAAFLAAHSHRGDLAIEELVMQWKNLRLVDNLRIDLRGLMGWQEPARQRRQRKARASDPPARFGRSLLDPRPLEAMVRQGVPWEQLHENIERGLIRGIMVAALHIGTGRTHLFIEEAPGADFRPSNDPRRAYKMEPIQPAHVLASSAFPLLFPARRVGEHYFCDGGLRFNTPISPVIRAGAERLVVVAVGRGARAPTAVDASEQYPDPFFLLGKLLAALLLDPVEYDLQVLERLNELVAVLEQTLDPEELQRFTDTVVRTRGAPYRQLRTLSFRPSGDIGRTAWEFLQERGPKDRAGRMEEWVLARAARMRATYEADLVSFVLFDGNFGTRLADMGRRDAHARAEAIVEFFKP